MPFLREVRQYIFMIIKRLENAGRGVWEEVQFAVKGLGEMDVNQLCEITLDQKNGE